MSDLQLRVKKFIDFINFLYQKKPQCFEYDHNIWTENYDGEDGIFAVFIRTLVCNDDESESVFKKMGMFEDVKSRSDKTNFHEWAQDLVKKVIIGPNPGDHRKEYRNKRHFAKTLKSYLDTVGSSQTAFFNSITSFQEAYDEVIKIHDVGPLFCIDFLERLDRSYHNYINYHPKEFYVTGTGVENGIRKLYNNDNLKGNELKKKGDYVLEKIIDDNIVKKDIAYFELETILCCYRKSSIRDKAIKYLEGKITTSKFVNLYAKHFCKSKKC